MFRQHFGGSFCVGVCISWVIMFSRFLTGSFSLITLNRYVVVIPGRNLRISLQVIRRGRIPADLSSQALEFFQ